MAKNSKTPAQSTKRQKIAKARGRSVKEWIGKTADSTPPPSVRLRVFDRHKGVCHITGRKIAARDKWDLDHIKRVEDGGENRESNLAPALRDAHKKKTAEETTLGKRADRIRKKHIGIKPEPTRPIQNRGFAPSEKQVERESKKESGGKLPIPPRRNIYGS